MRKEVQNEAVKLTALLKQVTLDTIFPFTEKPSINFSQPGKESDDKLGASELFSYFTADIIKEQTVFTR